jgi:hypothetical protein
VVRFPSPIRWDVEESGIGARSERVAVTPFSVSLHEQTPATPQMTRHKVLKYLVGASHAANLTITTPMRQLRCYEVYRFVAHEGGLQVHVRSISQLSLG